jgi:hypothetical protein
MDLKLYKAFISASMDSDYEVTQIALVDQPAIERNFQAFKDVKKPFKFAVDADRRIISGPAMIADLPIYRNDNARGEYFVMFDAAAIRTIVEKFAARGNMQKLNLMHDSNAALFGCTIFNSFIIDRTMGINPPEAFADLPNGSWFVSVHVTDDDVWADVKSGIFKGFSVEGIFDYQPVQKQKMSKAEAMIRIEEILNDTED